MKKWAYYNDNEPYAVEWLKQLIKAGILPDGEVDGRSIKQVKAEEVRGFRQQHWFAGIGGWAYALRLAGWPDDREVTTGSCPCQPYSVAGKRLGFNDPRDLWPDWAKLIGEIRPQVIFGEQVAAVCGSGSVKKKKGKCKSDIAGVAGGVGEGVENKPNWVARMRSDLGEMGYAMGGVPVEAACAGAAQYRDRFWFVASRRGTGWEWRERPEDWANNERRHARRQQGDDRVTSSSEDGVMAPDPRECRDGNWNVREKRREEYSNSSDGYQASQLPSPNQQCKSDRGVQRGGELGGAGGDEEDLAGQLATERGSRLERLQSFPIHLESQLPPAERSRLQRVVGFESVGWGERWTEDEFRSRGFTTAVASIRGGEWDGEQFIECPDGKYRRLPPSSVCWLGNGLSARVSKLRALGNSIYPPLAARFISASMIALQEFGGYGGFDNDNKDDYLVLL